MQPASWVGCEAGAPCNAHRACVTMPNHSKSMPKNTMKEIRNLNRMFIFKLYRCFLFNFNEFESLYMLATGITKFKYVVKFDRI